MSAQDDGALADLVFVFGQNAVAGLPMDLLIQMHQQTVVEHGDASGFDKFVALEHGRGKNDIEGLPFPRRTSSVNQGRRLSINSGGHAVGINLLVVRIEDLDFEQAHQEEAVVTLVVPGSLEM